MTKTFREKSPVISCTVSTTTYPLYTCPANCRAKIPLIYVNNVAGAITLDIDLYKSSSTTTFPILSALALSAGEIFQLSDELGFVLEAGDRIEVTCTGGTVEVTALCSIYEQFIPLG